MLWRRNYSNSLLYCRNWRNEHYPTTAWNCRVGGANLQQHLSGLKMESAAMDYKVKYQ